MSINMRMCVLSVCMVAVVYQVEVYSQSYEQRVSNGVELHDAVEASGADEEPLARALVEEWIQIEKEFAEPLVWAYLGSSWNLLARDSSNVLIQVDAVGKATQYLDRAVELDPDNIVIRRIRYANYLELPEFFGKEAVAAEDLDYLIRVYRDDPQRFEGVYDPAHLLFSRARLERRHNNSDRATGLARTALRMAYEANLISEIEEFLGM